MKKILTAAFIGVSALVSQPAHAEDIETKTLDVLCQHQDNRLASDMCGMYLKGIWEAYITITVVNDIPKMICLPKGGVSADQPRKVFLEYVDKHGIDYPKAAPVVIRALMKAYPCS